MLESVRKNKKYIFKVVTVELLGITGLSELCVFCPTNHFKMGKLEGNKFKRLSCIYADFCDIH